LCPSGSRPGETAPEFVEGVDRFGHVDETLRIEGFGEQLDDALVVGFDVVRAVVVDEVAVPAGRCAPTDAARLFEDGYIGLGDGRFDDERRRGRGRAGTDDSDSWHAAHYGPSHLNIRCGGDFRAESEGSY